MARASASIVKSGSGCPARTATRAKSEWHGIDPSVGAQIVEFFAVPAPAQALRSLAGYQKAFSGHTQRVVAAVERLHIDFGLSGFIGKEGQPLAVRREDRVVFVERRVQERNHFPVAGHVDGKNIGRKVVVTAGRAELL